MRKIDKTPIFSTIYKKWQDDLEAKNEPHPKYNSSIGEYYTDIAMNLFYCQNGLCAYTEVFLCPSDSFSIEKWSDGRYIPFTKKPYKGQLEHWDESLKSKNADTTGRKDWLWSNFFMAESDANRDKGVKTVSDLLKPDSDTYDPFTLLEYDTLSHEYSANTNLSTTQIKEIDDTIDTLGINHPKVVRHRKAVLDLCQTYGISSNILNEFPTAIAFLQKNKTP
jgi:hypothetical protein